MQENFKLDNRALPNGKKIYEVYNNVKEKINSIYLEGWAKGISIPFRDENRNLRLANPDGSEDLVEYNVKEKTYTIIKRVAEPGTGRYAYLLKQ